MLKQLLFGEKQYSDMCMNTGRHLHIKKFCLTEELIQKANYQVYNNVNTNTCI